ncbi:MAG: helix-turn-helix transcriptional regulator [Bacteroidota bacterium]
MFNSPVSNNGQEDSVRLNFIKKIQQSVEENYLKPDFNAHRLADELCVSRVQLYRKTKEAQLASPANLIRDRRLEEAFKLLISGEYCVTAACFDSGFNHLSYFARCFRKKYGVNPSEAAKGNLSN